MQMWEDMIMKVFLGVFEGRKFPPQTQVKCYTFSYNHTCFLFLGVCYISVFGSALYFMLEGEVY